MKNNPPNKFQKAGFLPVKTFKDGVVLKSSKGVILSYSDGNYEGFLKKSNKNSFREGKISSAISVLTLIGTLVTYFTTDITIVQGESMSPTYLNNEIIIHSRTARNIEQILVSRNCVVRFKSPRGDTCLKRVMGVPGDTIEYDYLILRINGKVVDRNNFEHLSGAELKQQGESYPKFDKRIRQKVSFRLKPNQYFVMGDNLPRSEDSRAYGPIEKTNILSIVQK